MFTALGACSLQGQGIANEEDREDLLNARADSISKVISQAKGGQRGEAWLALGLEFFYHRRDSAVIALDSAAAIFNRIDQGDRMNFVLGKKIILLSQIGRNKEANFWFEIAGKQIETLDSISFRGEVKLAAGKVKMRLGESNEALTFFQSALDDFSQIQDTGGVILSMEKVARMSWEDGAMNEALVHLDSCITLAHAWSGDAATKLILLYNNTGACLLSMGEPMKAEPYILKGIEIARSEGDSLELLFPYHTLGEMNVANNNLKQAKAYFRMAGSLLDQAGVGEEIALAKEALSMAMLLEYKFDSSAYWLNQCYQELDTTENFYQTLSIMVLRSNIFTAMGEYEKAVTALKEVDRLRSRWYTEEKARQLQEVRIEYETIQSEKENAKLRVLNETIRSKSQRNTNFFLTITVLVLLLVCLMTYFVFRLRKLNKEVSGKQDTLLAQNKELLELTAENELLVGVVAHDLKAPLSKIEGLMNMIVAQGNLSGSQLTALNMMRGVLVGGNELVKDILILSEAGQGRTPSLTKHDLLALLTSIERQFQNSATKKEISIRLNPPPHPVVALIHPPYISRILDNLVSNALKFSSYGTTIQIDWGTDEQGDWCSVQDQGPGIKASEVPKLFQRFSKLSNRPTAGESSSGLGLYIVKVLLEATQSSISVQTEEGKGTTFTIRFPNEDMR